MKNEICTIGIGNGFLDNDYTFFDDGSIKHIYDQNNYKLNQERMIIEKDISDSDKKKILGKCLDQYKEKIEKILSP